MGRARIIPGGHQWFRADACGSLFSRLVGGASSPTSRLIGSTVTQSGKVPCSRVSSHIVPIGSAGLIRDFFRDLNLVDYLGISAA